MKTFIKFLPILVLLCVISCKKEKIEPDAISEEIPADYKGEMKIIDLVCYPTNTSLTFSVQSTGTNGPYNYTWKTPSNLSGPGPFTIDIASNMIFDVDVTDSKGIKKNLKYEINKDTIDPLKHDYRKGFFGSYACHVTSRMSKQDSIGNWITTTNSYLDTVDVKAGTKFTTLYITHLSPSNWDVDLSQTTFGNIRTNGKFLPNDSIYVYNWSTPVALSSTTYLGKKINK